METMKEVVCFATLLFVVLVEGQTSQPAHNVQCYKKTTDPDEDFTCTWCPVTPLQDANYSLFYQAPQHRVRLLCSTPNLSCDIDREVLITKQMIRMWLEVKTANLTYRSAELTVYLDNQVKYDAPEIKKISRSSKKLTLWWNKQSEEHKGAVHEIALKQLDHEHWIQKTFETNDGQNIPELDSQPKVKWKVQKLKKGVRLLELMLEEYSRDAIFGGLMYQISTSPVPCWHEVDIVYTESTNYNLTIAASTVNVTLHANNSVGVSPETHITIPAQYLDRCPKNQTKTRANSRRREEMCIVWHRLTGETPKPADENHSTVNNTTQAFKIMNAEMEDFVRYHYFIYTKSKGGKLYTTDLCPMYKKEGAPRSSPGSLTVLNKTHSSAVLQWEPIPVSEQRGFLTHYVIYISGSNETQRVKVPGSQTNFTIQNLKHGSVYSAHLAGQTSVGVGPNTTETFQMKPNPPTLNGLPSSNVVIVTCAVTFSLLAFCILIVKYISDKLLPAVPSPVIPETPACRSENHNEVYPVGEEVDSLILQLDASSDGGGCESQQLEMEVCGTPSYEQDDGESRSDSEEPDESSLALNPHYKKQILSGPAQLTHQQNRCDAIPAYKNGLVLEMRKNAPEEPTESWLALG
ncbi:oncostatin-M-specific receptor subunit beta isoform X2 [Brienomyrus brachyistius]|uniref:oncostatin-M-specific receptor subunit beta isoform X2 n=1 Tax=Brienomyrus brachyistius TaxID=42636 RepID=UPI0020B3A72A|nr:oncostatin-M-specific receptor subunit beta isoform X2 [Brienomyrus brachyistius]